VLFAVHGAEPPPARPLSVKHIATLLGINKPAVTRAIDRLVNLKLVDCWGSNTDRRLVETKVTAEGAVVVGRLSDLVRKTLPVPGQ
jgi:DNA-binding MarR family transcriptional regulator